MVHPTVHTFSALKVSLPRLELERRNQYVEARKLHYDHAATNGLARDSARLCLEDVVPSIRRPVAIVDAGNLCLAPGERAIVPARWDRKVPDEDLWCEESSLSGVTVQAGLCAGNSQEVMPLRHLRVRVGVHVGARVAIGRGSRLDYPASARSPGSGGAEC